MDSVLPPNQNAGPAILGMTWSTESLAIIVVILRVWVRLSNKAWGLDDYTILVALALNIFGDIITTIEVNQGLGRHIEYLEAGQIEAIAKNMIINAIRVSVSVFAVKLSICFFLLRLLDKTHPRFRAIIVANITVYGIVLVIFSFIEGFQCIPLSKVWSPNTPGRCLSKTAINQTGLAGNVINVLTDFLYAILPVFIIHQLHMPRKTKNILAVILGFGILIAACSIGKSITFKVNTEDLTWAYRWVQIFATIESNLGVVVASLPALSKGAKIASTMLDSYRSRLLNSHRGRSDATPNSDQDISFGNYHKYERQGSNDDMEMPVLQKNQIVRSTEVYVEQS